MRGAPTPRLGAALLAAGAIGVTLQLLVAFRSQPLSSDTFHYMRLAESLVRGEGFVSGGSQHPDATRLPVYPLGVALAHSVLRDVELAAVVVTALCAALSVVPLFFLVRGVFGARPSWAAIVLGSVSCIVAVSFRALAEGVFLPLVLATMASIWRGARSGRAVALTAGGAFAGLAALTRGEGLAWILAAVVWPAVDAPGRGLRERCRRAALVFAAAACFYGPYVAWASARAGRLDPVPALRYVAAIREVSDRFGLRDAPGPPVSWTDRSRFLLTADRRAHVVLRYFETGVMPEPDPAFASPAVSASDSGAGPGDVSSRAVRRLVILGKNLRGVPDAFLGMHLTPPLLLALGGLGVAAGIRSRRRRRAMAFLAVMGAASLAPMLSHLESRFLFPFFAIGLVGAAAGWGALDSVIVGFFGRARFAGRALCHVAVAAGVVASAAVHVRPDVDRLQKAEIRRAAAAGAGEHLPPGPMLAIDPAIPFWAQRPYLAVPLGGMEAILSFARAKGAGSLAIAQPSDVDRLPFLSEVLTDPPPRGFRLVSHEERPWGGKVWVFALELSESTAESRLPTM